MNNDYTRAVLLIISLGIIAFPAMGTTLTIDNATLENIGDTTQVGFTLDQIPLGLAGYAVSISLENSGPAEIISVSFPSWATLNDNSTLPADNLTMMAADLSAQIGNGSVNVALANVTIRADALGTTRIIIDSYDIDDINGSPIIPVILGGDITILGSDTTPPASIADLQTATVTETTITWVWINPADSDFAKVMVYLDGTFGGNISPAGEAYTATGLDLDTEYTISTRTVDTSGNINATWVNQTARTAPAQPIAPDSIVNLTNSTYQQDLITWTWIDPVSADFDHVMVFLDGVFLTNVTRETQTLSVAGLSQSTAYTIATHTVGATGLINATWVNHTAWTAPAQPIAPDSIVNLTNTTYQQDLITWTWIDPVSADFDHVMVFLDGAFVTNVTRGTRSFTATGLSPSTVHTIGTHTVGATGGVNPVWVNNSAWTAPVSSGPKGFLYVYSIPLNAIIFIDGKERGLTKLLVMNVTAGVRNLTLTKPGYQTRTISVDVPAGDVKVLRPITLEPVSSPPGETGTVWVYSSPSNALITIDGTERGHTNQLVTGVMAGTRSLTLTKPGYQTRTLSVTVQAGELKVLPPIEMVLS